MNIYNWPTTVNTKFFNYSHKREDNSIITEFISGRKVGFNKNTKSSDVKTCSLLLTKTEDSAFWTWFDYIGGLAGAFQCEALGSGTYRFSDIPYPSESSQEYITLEMNIEEL